MPRKLILKKEILAELSTDELREVVAGNLQVLTTNAQICQQISLNPVGTCPAPSCGEGCTGRSTLQKG